MKCSLCDHVHCHGSETVDLQTAATLHPRPVSSKYLSGSRPLSVKPLEQHRHASARAKTSGRRLLAPIAGDRARTPNAVSDVTLASVMSHRPHVIKQNLLQNLRTLFRRQKAAM